jgi:hypothetical protein
MPTKLGRKQLPSGYGPNEFKYMGRPAKDQGDFGGDVGVADMACVNQFGESNNSKGYHGGVVQSGDGKWWVYLEWGRIKPGKSWNGSFLQQDFQFVECSSEQEARTFFAKQMASKNTKRLVQKDVGGVTVWAGKAGKDGYLVQSLATRERGLPDAYTIKDDSGVAKPAPTPAKKKAAKRVSKPTRTFQPQVISLAQALVGGTQTYTRALSQASGIVPTMDSITQVRDQLIPAALSRIAVAGNELQDQLRDRDLIDISKMVYAMVPKFIPRTGLAPEDAILNAGNILQLQQDLDAFEAALGTEDFTVEDTSSKPNVDPVKLLGAEIEWIDPRGDHGRWLAKTFQSMSNNRHSYLGRKDARIINMFSVSRPTQDLAFRKAVSELAAKRRGQKHGHVPAGLQPRNRSDLTDISDVARDANVFIGIHGTRPVNVAPILQGNLRLPKSLKGVHITGAAFGHGIYYATDFRKSYGYTGHGSAYYGGGGQIRGRGFFMFLCDVAGGKFHYPTRAWSINGSTCPDGADSVYAHPSKISSLANDEHVIFNPNHQRIRYIIEGSL